jgi:hypothetical protein|tara:strand:- start:432 stop:1115 length:684 start_codon:yes stop_codon:yes gene_type:complete
MSYLKNKPNSLEDMAKQMQIHTNESDYQDKFKKELDKAGKGIGSMTPKEKKDFFNKIDKMHTAKKENVNEEVNWTEAAEEQEKRSDEAKYYKAEEKSEIPAIDKDNKPGVKIAKIRAMKSDDKEKKESEIDKLKDQNALLKQKLENEKHKAVKPAPNKDTGEVPLSIGIAYKHLKDKMKTEAAKYKKEQKKDETQTRDQEMADPKGKTDTGQPKTPVEMNPKINHSF